MRHYFWKSVLNGNSTEHAERLTTSCLLASRPVERLVNRAKEGVRIWKAERYLRFRGSYLEDSGM